MKESQNKRVLRYMKERGGITSLEAVREFGCTRLAARIADLKREGVEIESETITVETRTGSARVKRYSLA